MDYFGQKLTDYCESKGTTPYYVSIEVGLPQSTMSLIINGERKPRPEHLQKIAGHPTLGISYEQLASWAGKSIYKVEAWPEEETMRAPIDDVLESEGLSEPPTAKKQAKRVRGK